MSFTLQVSKVIQVYLKKKRDISDPVCGPKPVAGVKVMPDAPPPKKKVLCVLHKGGHEEEDRGSWLYVKMKPFRNDLSAGVNDGKRPGM